LYCAIYIISITYKSFCFYVAYRFLVSIPEHNMKSQSLLLFAPLAAALAIGNRSSLISVHNILTLTIEPRQLGGGLGGAAAGLLTSGLTAMLKDTKPLKIEEGPSTMKMPGAKYMKITFGPYELLPAKEAAKQFNPTKMDKSSNAYQFIAKGFPGGAIVLRTNTTLEYEDGTYAGVSNNVYNHHVMFMDTTKSSSAPLMCAGASASQKMPVSTFAGVSAEAGPTYFSDKEGGFKSGYHLGKDNKILMTAEIVNYASEKKTVYVVAEVDYVDGNTPGVTDTSVSMLSVTQCDESAKGIVAPPADKKVFGFESKKLIAMQDGWILTRRGELLSI
jgi:hypothetical protein